MGNMIIKIMEIIGTVAFALSGSIIAARYGLDLFGVTLVGCVTAVCGGMLRDITLGNLPPAVFSNKVLLAVAAVTSVLVFIIFYFNSKRFEKLEKSVETANILFDAIGLAAFSITGMEVAFGTENDKNALLVISMGVITGIGGGIIRDILVDKIPYVLKKHIYALASIFGCIVYYIIRQNGGKVTGMFVSIPVMIIIRLLAAKYHWKLPKIKIERQQ